MKSVNIFFRNCDNEGLSTYWIKLYISGQDRVDTLVEMDNNSHSTSSTLPMDACKLHFKIIYRFSVILIYFALDIFELRKIIIVCELPQDARYFVERIK